jgi:hypothetical protein
VIYTPCVPHIPEDLIMHWLLVSKEWTNYAVQCATLLEIQV